jgi:hypothetical protein
VTEYDAAESFHIPCPLYGSKEWRCSVKPAPKSPSVPGHATFWAAVGKQFGTLPSNLEQNWCCLEACDWIWCCWIIPCLLYGSNEWWYAVSNQLLSPQLCVESSHVIICRQFGKKFDTVPSNLEQNWCSMQECHKMWCCWTIYVLWSHL